jgi:hypothetical protein
VAEAPGAIVVGEIKSPTVMGWIVALIASESGASSRSGVANAQQPLIRLESFDRREWRVLAVFFIDDSYRVTNVNNAACLAAGAK